MILRLTTPTALMMVKVQRCQVRVRTNQANRLIPKVPYISRLEREHNFEFVWVNAPVPTPPHASIAAFYDEPCYRYFHWAPSPIPFHMSQVRAAYKWYDGILAKQGPFDGVLGLSQGAVVSIAQMLHHAETHPDASPTALFRFAIFFSCPYLPDFDDDKEQGKRITWGKIACPSLHFGGEADTEWFEGGKSTFENNCVEGTATWVTHKDGHAIPKDKPTVEMILNEISKFMKRVYSEGAKA